MFNLKPYNINIKDLNLYFIFILNNESFKNLNNILKFFLSEKTNLGLIIYIDKNSFVLSKLSTIFKNIILEFHLVKKNFSFWGLPYCFLQEILGGFDYTRLSNNFVEENNYFHISLKNKLNSCLLIGCKKCIFANSCYGLGNNPINFSKFSWRADNKYRLETKIFVKFSKQVQQDYYNFQDYISKFSLEKTDRTITYAKVSTKNSSKNYNNRFIYFANYIDSKELKYEKEFLNKYLKNSEFLDFFFNSYLNFFQRLAFSLAYGKTNRLTLYGFFQNNSVAKIFLDSFFFKISNLSFEKYFHSIGFDFDNNKLSEIKIYSKIHNEVDFFNFLKKEYNFSFSNDFLKNVYNFLLVRRFDLNGNLKSIKIEMYFKDFNLLKKLIKKEYGLVISQMNKKLTPSICAIDFDKKGIVNRSTIYYWYNIF